MKALNLKNVDAKTAGASYPDIAPGGYICRILRVTDVPDKEYLRVDLDVATGEFKDYYKDLEARAGFWGCTQFWSYKEANLPYFKGNVVAVEHSNSGYVFSDANEQELVGKLVGAVFGEEEYKTSAGDIKCNSRPRFLCSVQRILDQDFTVPKKKAYDPAKDRRNRPAGYASAAPDATDWAQTERLPWDDDELPL